MDFEMKHKPTTFQKICRFCLGWLVIPIIARKNDRLAAVFIGYVMMGWEITSYMQERKAKLWRWCTWWGVGDEE